MPFTADLTPTADGKFALVYNPVYVTVTTDAAGKNVVIPGNPMVIPDGGDEQFYLKGVASTVNLLSRSEVSLVYDKDAQSVDLPTYSHTLTHQPAASTLQRPSNMAMLA